jgi:hypothetical protein
MLQEVLENDDFLKVFFEKRLVNISGTVRDTDLTFLQVNIWVYCICIRVYGSTAAPPILWWQKLELNYYLRNQASY